jgi:hypothetical protein
MSTTRTIARLARRTAVGCCVIFTVTSFGAVAKRLRDEREANKRLGERFSNLGPLGPGNPFMDAMRDDLGLTELTRYARPVWDTSNTMERLAGMGSLYAQTRTPNSSEPRIRRPYRSSPDFALKTHDADEAFQTVMVKDLPTPVREILSDLGYADTDVVPTHEGRIVIETGVELERLLDMAMRHGYIVARPSPDLGGFGFGNLIDDPTPDPVSESSHGFGPHYHG